MDQAQAFHHAESSPQTSGMPIEGTTLDLAQVVNGLRNDVFGLKVKEVAALEEMADPAEIERVLKGPFSEMVRPLIDFITRTLPSKSALPKAHRGALTYGMSLDKNTAPALHIEQLKVPVGKHINMMAPVTMPDGKSHRVSIIIKLDEEKTEITCNITPPKQGPGAPFSAAARATRVDFMMDPKGEVVRASISHEDQSKINSAMVRTKEGVLSATLGQFETILAPVGTQLECAISQLRLLPVHPVTEEKS